MEIDSILLTGIAGFLSAILVFCGSVFLLLALVMGARLAYFVSASVVLAFLLIMGVVWSIGDVPLGPVGAFGKPVAEAIPHWNPIDMGEDAAALEFQPASQYPDGGGWRKVDEEITQETTIRGEFANAAGDFLEAEIDKSEDGQAFGYEDASDAQINEDSFRLLTQDGTEYGMGTLQEIDTGTDTEAAEASTQPETTKVQAFVVMEFEPGNQFGKARMITAGTLILFVLHLFGLSRAERRAREEREENNGE